MARQVVWTTPALKDRKAILTYWAERNGSKTYSHRLFLQLQRTIAIIRANPYIGRPSDHDGFRVKLVGTYRIFYSISPTTITIVRLVDGRRKDAHIPHPPEK
jgi:plasmid stabilization system protein ParE